MFVANVGGQLVACLLVNGLWTAECSVCYQVSRAPFSGGTRHNKLNVGWMGMDVDRIQQAESGVNISYSSTLDHRGSDGVSRAETPGVRAPWAVGFVSVFPLPHSACGNSQPSSTSSCSTSELTVFMCFLDYLFGDFGIIVIACLLMRLVYSFYPWLLFWSVIPGISHCGYYAHMATGVA